MASIQRSSAKRQSVLDAHQGVYRELHEGLGQVRFSLLLAKAFLYHFGALNAKNQKRSQTLIHAA
jgi:hypothetical protein